MVVRISWWGDSMGNSPLYPKKNADIIIIENKFVMLYGPKWRKLHKSWEIFWKPVILCVRSYIKRRQMTAGWIKCCKPVEGVIWDVCTCSMSKMWDYMLTCELSQFFSSCLSYLFPILLPCIALCWYLYLFVIIIHIQYMIMNYMIMVHAVHVT